MSISTLIKNDNLIDLKSSVQKLLDEKRESFYQEKKKELSASIISEAIVTEDIDPEEIEEEDPNFDVDIDPLEIDIEALENEIWDDDLLAEFEDEIEDIED